jgi:serine/threonine protein kinase
VMEYCPVGSISDIMLLVRDRGINERLVAAVCKAVLLGLNYLHHANKVRQILVYAILTYGQVHRDIKPEYHIIVRSCLI